MVTQRFDGLHLGTKGLRARSSGVFQNCLAVRPGPVLPLGA